MNKKLKRKVTEKEEIDGQFLRLSINKINGIIDYVSLYDFLNKNSVLSFRDLLDFTKKETFINILKELIHIANLTLKYLGERPTLEEVKSYMGIHEIYLTQAALKEVEEYLSDE